MTRFAIAMGSPVIDKNLTPEKEGVTALVISDRLQEYKNNSTAFEASFAKKRDGGFHNQRRRSFQRNGEFPLMRRCRGGFWGLALKRKSLEKERNKVDLGWLLIFGLNYIFGP